MFIYFHRDATFSLWFVYFCTTTRYSNSLIPTFVELIAGPCQPVSGWGGGLYSKIWAPFHSSPPPKKKIFPESKKGGGRRYFFVNKSSRNLSQNNFSAEISKIFSEEILIFKKFCNSSMPGPPPRKLGPPFLLFFGGGYTPPPPPGGTALANSHTLRTNL
jgi:hypothetical protein